MRSYDVTKTQQRVVLRDEANRKWLDFTFPCQIISTHRIGEVQWLIHTIEESVQQKGLYAAGFISYEAAPAFDPSLTVKSDGAFPLLWFGLFKQANEIIIEHNREVENTSIRWYPSVTQEEYRCCLNSIRSHIRNGDTYQVNFTYRLRAITNIDPWRLFVRIAGNDESPLAAFVDTGEWAICSASPELFLRLDGNQLESRPMKGTAARGLWFEDDLAKRDALIRSEKERAENVMIVDMVRNDLGRVAFCGSVQVPSLIKVEKYPTVWQLTSTVHAQTNAPLHQVLQASFPPASITGAPKRRTMEIIADLESSPRRIYTGAIGFIAPGNRAQFNVAIRTALLHKPTGRAEYGTGGGIVWDSKPEDEYEESTAKTRVLATPPRDFDLLETMLWSYNTGYTLLEYHLKRLARSAEYFSFHINLRKIMEELTSVAAGLSHELYKVRLLVSRLGRIRCEPVFLKSTSLSFGDVILAKSPIDTSDIFLYHKTTRRIVYEDAIRGCPGNDDVLLFNEAGYVTETTVANIAVEIEGVLYTPPVQCGLLPGTQRARLLERAQLRERTISIQEVLSSPNVYLLNAVRGIHKVRIRESE